ncbi:histidine kinase [Runella rosea]|uniref:histidine kinase n=1 Tax=Runella rosea TaxID=2259595 RepID=A0A344TGR2_9BACT|nr:response regulator [Runella rosea]AXE17833.1 histidine kinase [Runella rosea]
MKLTIAAWLLIGSAFTILIGIFLGISFFNTIQRQVEEAEWVKEKNETLDQLLTLEKLLVDIETGQRAYRSTNEKRFLSSLNQAQINIGLVEDNLTNSFRENSPKLAQLAQIQQSVQSLVQLWSSTSENDSGLNRQSLIEITALEKKEMDNVRMLVKKIYTAERYELSKREASIKTLIENLTRKTVLGTFLLFLVAAVLTYFYALEFKSRKKIENQLSKNVEELEELNHSIKERSWYLAGLTVLNDALQNINTLEALGQSALKSITDYLELPAGGMYILDESEKLALKASVALSAQVSQSYALGEGLVGQAALERQIRITKLIPSSYWTIESGSGATNAGEIACIPLWYGKELKGVIELASFSPFPDHHIELLKKVSKDISLSVNEIQSRLKVGRLLEQLKEQKAILENQQDELRQTNEELSHQTESLMASEEELRVQEEELRHINSELEEKNEAIEVARQALALKAKELEVTSTYKSEFLANMSHELRTPLNSVLILANLLSENKSKNLTDKQVEYANVIRKSGTDLLKLINDILDLSKIEAGKIDFQFENVPVKNILRDIKQLFEVVADEKGVIFLTKIEASVPTALHTDKQRLEQIIQNLLSNAFKFTPKNGQITLSFAAVEPQPDFATEALKKAEQVLAISVEDTGVGIPFEKQQLIFEAFQQADGSTSRRYGGTGLGLSIIRELVKRLGGEVRLQSEVGKGSTFSVFIPLKTNAGAAAASSESLTISEKRNFSMTEFHKEIVSQTKIEDDRHSIEKGDLVMLIIEDDPMFAGIVRDLARDKNYKTIVALQGDEGMMYAQKYQPSAIILDVQLPVVDGQSILSWIKNDEQLKHIPVHVISGADASSLSLEGAQAFIQKPVKTQDLEKVFSLLEAQLNVKIKKVLILVGEFIQRNTIGQVLGKRYPDLKWEVVVSEQDAADHIAQNDYDCLIVDIRKNLDQGMERLRRLKEVSASKVLPVIVYIDEDLNLAKERQLKKLSSVIIRESTQSMERLMDEMELFLFKVQEVETKKLPQPTVAFSSGGLEGKKVLLVDDDMRNVFALSTLLEEQQMKVITADNGREALEELRLHTDIDIVLMDIMMPEMDGYEATSRIRHDLRLSKLPIIALTAKAMPEDREKVIEAGASDYITKPVDTGQLFSLMRVWLSK